MYAVLIYIMCCMRTNTHTYIYRERERQRVRQRNVFMNSYIYRHDKWE